MLPSPEHRWRAQAEQLLGRRSQKEVTGIQAPGETERPPLGLGRKALEGREAPKGLMGPPSSFSQSFLQPRTARPGGWAWRWRMWGWAGGEVR